ncbi:MAG: right-handed parallel beta-helix repeat-containing protein [Acidobacteria bacterium]|nr:right-handed parallel beta-helix repeat-containing protein [Acidobacteriota bacterium]
MSRSLILCSGLLLAASALHAGAAEARVPLYTTTTITVPGTYVLTRNITGPGPLISIQASDVDVDLNGFNLTPTSGAAIDAQNQARISVHDGFIENGSNAVRFDTIDGGRIERLNVAGQTGAGLNLVGCTGIVIRDLIVRNTGAEGVLFDAGPLATPGIVEVSDSLFSGIGTLGISLRNAGASLVAKNGIDTTGARGLLLDGCTASTVRDNIVRSTVFAGIALVGSNGCQLLSNIVRLPTNDGILVDQSSNENMLARNQVSGGLASGINVGGDRNVLDRNQSNGNSGWGLRFNSNANDNVYRTNMARGNTGGACGGGTADFCDQGAGNTSFGDNFLPVLR